MQNNTSDALCKLLLEGKLAQAGAYLVSSPDITEIDNTAVYLVVKHYSHFLKETAQMLGIGYDQLWISDNEEVQDKRKSVLEILQQMMKIGWSPNSHNVEETSLLCAVSTHDEELVKLLLENDTDVNCVTQTTQMNAVALAIILNDAGLLKLLISFGANVNEPCCQRLTPLQLSMNKSIKVSKILLQNGADVQQVMQMRGSNEVFVTSPPLIHAVETSNLYLASILLEHGEDVNQCYGECSDSSIHFAIKHCNNDMVKLLIPNGANLNKRNGRGHTPLGLALHHCENDSSVSETLLAAGCSRNKGSIINVFRKHFPPLHIAAFLGSPSHFSIVKLLLEKSLQVKKDVAEQQEAFILKNQGITDHRSFIDDIQSDSPVVGSEGSEGLSGTKLGRNKHILSNSERATDLQEQGQQDFINTPAVDKSTALYMSVLGGNLDISRYLVENGADPYNTCMYGTLLHSAVMARRKNEEVLKFALQYNFDIDLQNEDGNTCLILAARNNTPAVCNLLLESGALLDIQDGRYGETALSASVYFGFENNAEVLLSHGANPDLPDFRDTTALYWAIFNCREKSLRLLLEAGALLSRDELAKYPKNIKVMKNPELKKLLQQYVSEPPTLQQCCRLVLRKFLIQLHHGKSILTAVKSLPLPGKLKSYLALKAVN